MGMYRDTNVHTGEDVRNFTEYILISEQIKDLPASCLAGDNDSSC